MTDQERPRTDPIDGCHQCAAGSGPEVVRLLADLDEWRIVYRPGDEVAQVRARNAELASENEKLRQSLAQYEDVPAGL